MLKMGLLLNVLILLKTDLQIAINNCALYQVSISYTATLKLNKDTIDIDTIIKALFALVVGAQ